MSDDLDQFPRVLIVDLSTKFGGSSSRVLSLMSSSGKKRIALAGLKSSAVTKEALKLGLKVHIIGDYKWDPFILLRLVNLISSQKYQVLDTQNIQSKFWASLASLVTDTSLVSTINSWYENEHSGSIKGFIYGKLELLTNKNLDLYITVSQQDRRSLLSSNITEDQIELIYNAVDLDPQMVGETSLEIRKKYDLSGHSLICTAVGRLVPVKGYDILVDAVGLMAGRIPELFCLIVGEGECRDSLNKQIMNAGLQGHVRLMGFQDRPTILSLLKASDIFVMPSRYEGTPVALLEAAGMACPILASSIGGIPELVKSGEHALLVPPENSIALAEGLEKLCKDRVYARQLGENAQKRIFENFDLKSQVSATWNAYRMAWTKHNISD